MAKRDLKKITLRTVPNGYTLKVDDQEYMCWNEMDLLAAFMVHVGLQETDYMEKGNILTMLFQTMIGQEWQSNLNKMKQRVDDMEKRVSSVCYKLERMVEEGENFEPKIVEMKGKIEEIRLSIASQSKSNRQALSEVNECRNEMGKILAKVANKAKIVGKIIGASEDAIETMILGKAGRPSEQQKAEEKKIEQQPDKEGGNDDTFHENDGDTKKKAGRTKSVDNGGAKPKKSADKKSEKKPAAKAKSSRKKNDEVVLKELEKQLKEHWEETGTK